MDPYFLDETIFVFPDDRENEILADEFKTRIRKSQIPIEAIKEKGLIRIKIMGFASDIESLKENFRKKFLTKLELLHTPDSEF